MVASLRILAAVGLLLAAVPVAAQSAPAAPGAGLGVKFTPSGAMVECYDTFEVRVDAPAVRRAAAAVPNPFTEVSLTGEFRLSAPANVAAPAGTTMAAGAGEDKTSVEGFCDSADGSVFRIRFMPAKAGVYAYSLKLHEAAGLDASYQATVTAMASKRAGILRVDPKYPWHFIWEGIQRHCFVNGTTAFLLMGWQDDATITGIIDRLHGLDVNRMRVLLDGRSDHTWTEPFKTTAEFHPYLNPWQAARPDDIDNPGFDFTRFNPDYWQSYERMVKYARDKDMVVSCVFFWNDDQAHPAAGSADERRYFRYAVARLGAFSNVTWDLGDDLDSFRDEKWTHETGTFLHEIDPYHHLATSHPVNNDHQDRSAPWFSMTSFQEWHRPLHAWLLEQRVRQAKTGRLIPQMDEEYGYEDHYPEWAPYKPPAANADGNRRTAWEISMAGCYQTTGETAKRGTGVAPDTGGGWVNGRGDKTMTMLSGYAIMVRFFESVEWWKGEPHDELVGNADHDAGKAMCLAAPGSFYIVYLPHGGAATVDFKLDQDPKTARYAAQWFNPRTGKSSAIGKGAEGQAWRSPDAPDAQDWAILLQKPSGAP